MKKRVLWIDDSPDAMRKMLPGWINKLWKDDCRSDIAIFGNAAMDEENFDEEVLNEKIHELEEAALSEFFSFIILVGATEDEENKEKCDLIRDLKEKDTNKFFDVPHSKIVSDYSALFQEINNEYMKSSFSIDSKDDKGNLICDSLVNRISKEMHFDNYDEIMIDLRLSAYDNCFFRHVYNLGSDEDYRDDKPLLSMLIYHFIKTEKKDKSITLFSSYNEPERFITNWINIYRKIFLNNADPKEDELVFYDRKSIKLEFDHQK